MSWCCMSLLILIDYSCGCTHWNQNFGLIYRFVYKELFHIKIHNTSGYSLFALIQHLSCTYLHTAMSCNGIIYNHAFHALL